MQGVCTRRHPSLFLSPVSSSSSTTFAFTRLIQSRCGTSQICLIHTSRRRRTSPQPPPQPPFEIPTGTISSSNRTTSNNTNNRSSRNRSADNRFRTPTPFSFKRPMKYYNEGSKTHFPSKPIRPITPSYLEKANEAPVVLSTPQRLLVILDLNGTLFFRLKRNNRAVTPRPFLAPFLDFLFAHCRVMVWSSSQPHSVEAMLSCGFGERVSKLDRVWTRKHFRLPQVDYERKVLTIKDLEFVWDGIAQEKKSAAADNNSNNESASVHVEFDQTNTVLIDDSMDKIQLQPYNGIALTDFDEDLAKSGADMELLRVRRYLEKLIYQENVSAYMRVHPYKRDYPLDEDAVKEVTSGESVSEEQVELTDELDDLANRLDKSRI